MRSRRGMSALAFVLALSLAAVASATGAYELTSNFTGDTFFDNFSFYTGADPTNGYVDYVSREVANASGLISASAESIRIGCDNTNVASGRGRASVRLESLATWSNGGLFVADLDHMPSGCATWPALWMYGPQWPDGGEIDIIEGINTNTNDQSTLHTSDGCEMNAEPVSDFTGSWATGKNGQPSTDCFVGNSAQYNNAGCGIINTGVSDSYGAPFNAGDGGVYVMEWTEQFIRMFMFPRNAIPADLSSGKPNPSAWGLPYAYFTLAAGSCPASHFTELTLVINLTFCGDWASAFFASQCPNRGTCEAFTQNNPSAFDEAYWNIRSVAVYEMASESRASYEPERWYPI